MVHTHYLTPRTLREKQISLTADGLQKALPVKQYPLLTKGSCLNREKAEEITASICAGEV